MGLFSHGNWMPLSRASEQAAEAGTQASARRARRPEATVEKRAARALQLVQMGELSTGRQALEGAELAPGTLATRAALTDPERRPPKPRVWLPPALTHHRPQVEFELSSEGLCKNLRTSRRGAEAGPSGMTSEHLRVLLYCPMATVALVEVATALSRADVPEEIKGAIRLGRLTALRKPNGGLRGIVAGDIVRRLVARTMAQEFSKRAENATAPFQCALSTRAGTECVTHVLQTQIWTSGPQWSPWMASAPTT